MIWRQSGLVEPPPMMRMPRISASSPRMTPMPSRRENPTPSSTARVKWALVWRIEMPVKLPRRSGSKYGVSSPIR